MESPASNRPPKAHRLMDKRSRNEASFAKMISDRGESLMEPTPDMEELCQFCIKHANLLGVKASVLRSMDATALQKLYIRARLNYNESNAHIAILGGPGAGKSAFINAIRGIQQSSPEAAGETAPEVTSGVIPFAPLGPQSRVVYYDVLPPADHLTPIQYFKLNALYIMDMIIILHGDRIVDNDIKIIMTCALLDIPFLLVRWFTDRQLREIRHEVGETYPTEEHLAMLRKELDDELTQSKIKQRYAHALAPRNTNDQKPESEDQKSEAYRLRLTDTSGGELSFNSALSNTQLIELEISRRIKRFQMQTLDSSADLLKMIYEMVDKPLPCNDVHELIFMANKSSLYGWARSQRRDQWTTHEPLLVQRIQQLTAELDS